MRALATGRRRSRGILAPPVRAPATSSPPPEGFASGGPHLYTGLRPPRFWAGRRQNRHSTSASEGIDGIQGYRQESALHQAVRGQGRTRRDDPRTPRDHQLRRLGHQPAALEDQGRLRPGDQGQALPGHLRPEPREGLLAPFRVLRRNRLPRAHRRGRRGDGGGRRPGWPPGR